MKQRFGQLPNLIWGCLLLWVLWLGYMLFKLNTIAVTAPEHFSSFGILGDSFGMMGGFFASLALIFTAITNNQIAKDRKIQYEKQIHDLLVLEREIASAQYYLESGKLSFYPAMLLQGRIAYFSLRDEKFDSLSLNSSIDALLFSLDLAIKYIANKLISDDGYIKYRIDNAIKDPNITLYLHTLKKRRENLNLDGFPFPNLYEKVKAPENN
ncbi:hypothetical protein [Deinococcus sp. AJ005]|uniref:hypothetical protein n=1 Tax=Deinococcus sp. AJ005 TaxID=2652443 RepID=UPI00125CB002|nr:hypothetical protein [Deinococcus sp. AJ005]QFP77076.1 hypothetical protein DAAJ005_11925 [Deinococcus sp. AJ005]